MARLAPSAALALVGLLAGCAGSHAPPCGYCDGGNDGEDDSAVVKDDDLVREDTAGDDATRADLRPSSADMRDLPVGESRPPTPLPDAGYVFTDDFQNAEAPGWQVVGAPDRDASTGGWSVISGSSGSVFAQGLLDQNTWHIAYATTSLGPDQIVEARLRVIDFYAPSPAYAAAVFARYDPDADSGYLVDLRGDGSVTLRRRYHGTTASWAGGAPAGIHTGVWYTVRLEVIGNTINSFLDGQPVYSVTDDTPLEGGGVALGTLGATLEVDRVSAGDP